MKFKVLAGLGNPGEEFENTYHNVGIAALDYVVDHFSSEPKWKSYQKLIRYASLGTMTAVKPQTYMNDSGRAIVKALAFFNAEPNELLVIHDESDLPLGTFKFSTSRGSAGHKGIESLITQLGTKEFSRIRIGIRPPRRTTREKAGSFVLSTIRKEDRDTLYGVFEEVASLIKKLIENEHP